MSDQDQIPGSARDHEHTHNARTEKGPLAHTPGPWRIEGHRGNGLIISAGVNAEGDGPSSYIGVLDPMFHVAGEGNLHANGDLICAAPDMLAMLREVLTVDDEWKALTLDQRSRVEAAILKATGAA